MTNDQVSMTNVWAGGLRFLSGILVSARHPRLGCGAAEYRRHAGRRHGLLRHRLLRQRNSDAEPRCPGGRRLAVHAVLQLRPLQPHAGVADHRPLSASGRHGLARQQGRAEVARAFTASCLPRCVTIAEVLEDAGYFTAMTGKWHLGQQNGTPPWERGFMRSLNSRYGEVYFPKEADRPGTTHLYLNGKEIPKDDPMFGKDWYSTDLFTEWGLKFIDEAQAEKKPFFLYIAQGAAHFPLRAPAETIAKYRGATSAGWDKLRAERYARQIEMGLVDAQLAARAAAGRVARLGHSRRRPAGALRADDGRLCGDDRPHRPVDGPAGRGPQGAGPARQHADPVPERQRRQRRGRSGRRHRRRPARSAGRSRASSWE